MDRLSVGMHVDIMRSDGRVHGALVTQLRHDTRVVSVEWFEKGETKGKEVDLAALMRNNQTLFQQSLPPSNIAAPPPPLVAASAIEKTNVVNTRSRVSMPATKLINPAPTAVSKLNDTFSGMNSVENKPESRRTMLVGNRQENNNTSVLEGITSRKSTVATSRIPPVRPRVLANVPENTVVESKKEVEQPAMTPATEELIAPIPKSQVVSKIEEMEKSREQRRVQQTEAKKQREIQKNIDPGNPNWQFLSMIRDYQSQVDYKPLRMADAVVENRICVCVRKRPINKKEIAKKEIEVITIPNKDHMVVHQPQTKVDLTKYLDNQIFRYDYTFDENTTNEMVYKFTAQPLVRTIFQRGFATCFAYGQTGSGKTHTMGGVFEGGKGAQQDCTNGIYALTATDVFKMLNSADNRNEGLSASCSFFEIYGAKVFDLLGKKAKLRVLEDGKKLVQVVGLKEFKVHKTEDVLKLIRQGSEQRTAGQTSANSNSSRSHAVFQIILRKREGNNENLFGKFSLIDLAGNERGADTISSDRQTRLEGAEINKSLLALKECIRAMGRDEQHVPFRGSKLTLILRDSFIGKNAKVCMIAMISPGMSCVENSLNTLRYADRVKELGNENGMPTASPMSDDDFLVAPAPTNMTASQYEEEQEEIEEKAVRQRDRNVIDREYQQAVENMSKAEEKAIDEQQNLFEKLQKSVDTIAIRLEETNMVDYDYETHARASIKEACDIINAASKCKATYEKFLEKIGEEQEISARYGRK